MQTDFRLCQRFANVDVSNPYRDFSDIEQLAICGKLFRGIPLTSRKDGLIVSGAHSTDSTFSSDPGVLRVCRPSPSDTMLGVQNDPFSGGFLVSATRSVINACRKACEVSAGYKPANKPSPELASELATNRLTIAKRVLELGLITGDVVELRVSQDTQVVGLIEQVSDPNPRMLQATRDAFTESLDALGHRIASLRED